MVVGGRVFTIFNYISPLRSYHAPIKLICMVDNFIYCHSKIGGAMECIQTQQKISELIGVTKQYINFLLGKLNNE